MPHHHPHREVVALPGARFLQEGQEPRRRPRFRYSVSRYRYRSWAACAGVFSARSSDCRASSTSPVERASSARCRQMHRGMASGGKQSAARAFSRSDTSNLALTRQRPGQQQEELAHVLPELFALCSGRQCADQGGLLPGGRIQHAVPVQDLSGQGHPLLALLLFTIRRRRCPAGPRPL